MKIFVEVMDKRHWRFYTEPQPVDQPQAPGTEFKRGLFRRLELAYETTRRAIDQTDRGLLLKLGQVVRYLESKIDPEESLMKRLRKAESLEVVYPARFKESLVRRRFAKFIRRRGRHHWRGFIMNFFLLPVTGAMMLLPGPNVFFGWNAFRLISHYLAREGVRRVQSGQCQLRFVSNHQTSDIREQISV
jgi:hypothetical protein